MTGETSSSPGEIALVVENLTKAFGQVIAVKGISFKIASGQVVGILGPNGAGKSTTIRVCLGLTKPTSGAVRIFQSAPTNEAVRGRVGYSPETPYFYPFLTAAELLTFYAGLQMQFPDQHPSQGTRSHGLSSQAQKSQGMRSQRKRFIKTEVERVLSVAGLSDSAGRRVGHFSKGMIQRLAVAQSLLGDPDMLFLDEPSSGLDPKGRLEMRAFIKELRQQGKTVLLSSHILSDIQDVCDRILIMRKGTLVADRFLKEESGFSNGSSVEVEVEVKHLSAACLEALSAQGWSCRYEPPILHVLGLKEGEEPRILAVLADNHAQVFRFERKRTTLEEFYMQLMQDGGEDNADSHKSFARESEK